MLLKLTPLPDDDDERPGGLRMQPRRIGGLGLSTIAHYAVD